jgi:hypothetical protein
VHGAWGLGLGRGVDPPHQSQGGAQVAAPAPRAVRCGGRHDAAGEYHTPAGAFVRLRPRAAASTSLRPQFELILGDATVRMPAGFDPAELHSSVQILATLR